MWDFVKESQNYIFWWKIQYLQLCHTHEYLQKIILCSNLILFLKKKKREMLIPSSLDSARLHHENGLFWSQKPKHDLKQHIKQSAPTRRNLMQTSKTLKFISASQCHLMYVLFTWLWIAISVWLRCERWHQRDRANVCVCVWGEASHHGNHYIRIIKRISKAHYFTHQHNSCSTYPSREKKSLVVVLLEFSFSRNIKFQRPVFTIYGIWLQNIWCKWMTF